ncbi:MAG TPA: rubrerythrin family protein [Candidatus Brocadiia bacterium]|nr:rubrerythrin family protein [Candidatus Brocadiia bacterium]
MSTDKNLKEAFAGESQANRKYLAFAIQAEKDGFPGVARLFRAVAEAETVHAHAHLKVMKGVGKTADNLKAAIEGEGFEFKEMYPKFVAEADAENQTDAAMSFRYAMAVEELHHGLYGDALAMLEGGEDIPADMAVYVCPVCGNTVIGIVPQECPICTTSGDKFAEIK